MTRPHIVAAAQMTSGPDVERNIEAAVALVREARRRGADVVGLPENFSYMGPERDKPSLAESLEGPTLSALREVARSEGIAVVAGTIPELTGDPDHVHNTCAFIDRAGELRLVYRKIHLFDVELADGSIYKESGHILPGQEVVSGPDGDLVHGLSVCYDVRFPELYRRLEQAGARLFWVPAAFTLHTGKDHWEILLRARAVENGAYVAAPAQFGRHGPSRVTYGNAMVIDPWGKVLARAEDRPNTLAIAAVDLEHLEAVRRELPTWRHHVL